MNFKHYFLVVSLLIITTVNAFSQGEFSIHVGPTFPLSDFASDNLDDDKAGLAAVGIGFGWQYIHPFAKSGLGLLVGADVNINGLQKSFKDDFEEGAPSDVSINYPKYFNVPITAGLNYYIVNDDNLSLFANAGLVGNLLKITDFEITQGSNKLKQTNDLSYRFGFKAGCGVVINRKVSVAFNYYGIGKHDITGELTVTGNPDQKIDGEQKVDFLTITLGLNF